MEKCISFSMIETFWKSWLNCVIRDVITDTYFTFFIDNLVTFAFGQPGEVCSFEMAKLSQKDGAFQQAFIMHKMLWYKLVFALPCSVC